MNINKSSDVVTKWVHRTQGGVDWLHLNLAHALQLMPETNCSLQHNLVLLANTASPSAYM